MVRSLESLCIGLDEILAVFVMVYTFLMVAPNSRERKGIRGIEYDEEKELGARS